MSFSAEYKGYQAKNLSLNMARGKPSAKQLELALGVLEALKARSEFANSNGDDCRNYGLWDGLPEMKRDFSPSTGRRTGFAGHSRQQLKLDDDV